MADINLINELVGTRKFEEANITFEIYYPDGKS